MSRTYVLQPDSERGRLVLQLKHGVTELKGATTTLVDSCALLLFTLGRCMEPTLDVQVNLRMSQYEAQILDEMCDRWRCTRSEVIRTLLRGPSTADVQGRGRRDKMSRETMAFPR